MSERGLTTAQARERADAGLGNDFPDRTSRTLWHILRSNLFSLFNGIAFLSFGVLIALGAWSDALFGFFVIANVGIGVVQEFTAKRTLDRLALLNTPSTRVLRDGQVTDVPRSAIVIDDVVLLAAGDQLSADAVVIDCRNLEIDESIITGEADAIMAAPGREVLSGSTVVAGTGTARVVRVGADSFANTIAADARRFSLVDSELRNGIMRVIRLISWALLPLAALAVNGQVQAVGGWQLALQTGSWRQAAIAAIASIIAMVPQGLVFMTSVAFAVGAVTLSRHRVLVQELPAVEGLARVDMLCLDKTGTITEGAVLLDEVLLAEDADVAAITDVLGWFADDRNANATTRALRTRFGGGDQLASTTEVAFSSRRKWSAVGFADGALAGSWVLGAPEVLIDPARPDGPLSTRARELAASGLRTVVLGHCAAQLVARAEEEQALPGPLEVVAVLTFRERVRPDAATTLAYFKQQGVGIRVFSGDSPQTVAAVARDAGLEVIGEPVDARLLPQDPGALPAILEHNNIFGRVSPAQKKDLIMALQATGHTVAMTGDGVNDAMALKQADIGIAMGSGAATSRAVARLVLLDGQFSHLPKVIDEGRRVIANVERLSKLFLTKTVFAVLLAVVFGLLLWPFPFLPRQFAAVDGLTIGLPALVLAVLPKAPRYRAGYLRRAAAFCIPSGLSVGTALVALNVYARLAGYELDEIRSASVITLVIAGIGVLAVLARPLTPVRVILIATMCLGAVGLFGIPLASGFFGLVGPGPDLLWAGIITGAAGAGAAAIINAIQERASRRPHGAVRARA